MCGIAGYYAFSGSLPDRRDALAAMSRAMIQRGPDGEGVWSAEGDRIAFAHRRLSIIAPGPDGAQPMHYADGRFTTVFNGEIYNYRELRRELEGKGHVFASHGSDTETILAAFAEWGPQAFRRLRGMFAIAIWDSREQALTLARDPYGIKPLYISHRKDGLTFASQLRALAADPSLPRDLDPAGLAGFAIWGSVPEPFTILRAAEMVPAGRWLRFDKDGNRSDGSIEDIGQILAAHEDGGRTDTAGALRGSLAAHLVADVEVGCFLSSGVDSSAIAGMMHDCVGGRLRAITLAFDEYAGTSADEIPLAAEIAERYGFTHEVARVTADDFAQARPRIAADMDQPSIDGVNTWLVSRSAHRAGLKVALSGLGGDEILAGYSTFRDVPRTLRAGTALGMLPGGTALSSWGLRTAGIGGKAALAPRYANSLARTYLLRRAMLLPEQIGAILPPELAAEGLARLQPVERVEQALVGGPKGMTARIALLEATHYMRNQLLRDSDWAGMAHSLEIRVPLVDTVLLAAMAPHQAEFGTKPGSGKRCLADSPRQALPAHLVARPKTGFQVPVTRWTSADGAALTKGSLAWAKNALWDYLNANALAL